MGGFGGFDPVGQFGGGVPLPKVGGTPAQWQKKTNISSGLKGMDQMLGNQGGMDTSGRGRVIPPTDEFGNEWRYGPNSGPPQRTPEQAAADLARENEARRAANRAQQGEQITDLQAAARGEGPSAAQDQLQLATDQNMRQALAMAASGRGNPALANQAAGRQRAMMSQQHGSQAGALRAQEMQSAQQQLSGALQAQRGQDLADQQRELQYKQLEAQKQMQYDQMISNQKIAKSGGGSDLDALMNVIGTGAAAYGAYSAFAASDEDVKKNKSNVPDKDVDEFYKALQSKNFEYKDPHAAGSSGGEKVGMMAQDVEDTKLGDKLFKQAPDGTRGYDPQVLDGILLAGLKRVMKEQKYGDA